MKSLSLIRLLKVFSASCAVVFLLSACSAKPEGNSSSFSVSPSQVFISSPLSSTPDSSAAPQMVTFFDAIEAFEDFQKNHQKLLDQGYFPSSQKMTLEREADASIPTIFGNAEYVYSKNEKSDLIVSIEFWYHLEMVIEKIENKEGDDVNQDVYNNTQKEESIVNLGQENVNDTIRIRDFETIKEKIDSYYPESLSLKYLRDLPSLPKDPVTKEEYRISFVNQRNYCISTVLKGEIAERQMANDDGNDPLQYEIGDGCKEL
jgi:hypothetical protein